MSSLLDPIFTALEHREAMRRMRAASDCQGLSNTEIFEAIHRESELHLQRGTSAAFIAMGIEKIGQRWILLVDRAYLHADKTASSSAL